MTNCTACNLPPPNNWCWQHRIDCPLRMPPRNVTADDLWHLVAEHERRIAALEGTGHTDGPELPPQQRP